MATPNSMHSMSLTPFPPTHPRNENLDFSISELSIKRWPSTPPPPPPRNGNFSSGLDFEILKLTSESRLPPTHPPTPEIRIWDFSISRLGIKILLPTHPPTPEMGIWDFSISGVGNKVGYQPTHPPQKWEFGILAFLDLASKVGCQLPPYLPQKWGF